MTKNEELNEELFGCNFQVYRVSHLLNKSAEEEPAESVIKDFESVEEAFDKVEQVVKQIGKILRKKNPKSVVVYEPTEFGTVVIENGMKISSVLIRELERAQVS